MQFNLLGSGSKQKSNKRKLSSKAKARGVHKKTYSRKQGNLGQKQMSSGKQSKLDEFSSPYKFGKKGKIYYETNHLNYYEKDAPSGL